jgi:hypothetical protein
VAKRNTKAAPTKARLPPETKLAWSNERHSGEGAASALATLQKMEKSRTVSRPTEPKTEEPDS